MFWHRSMTITSNSPRGWLIGTVAFCLAGVGCLMSCLPLVQAATLTPAHHEALSVATLANEETDAHESMPCHAPAKSENSVPSDQTPTLPRMPCCLAEALPATYAKSFAPPAPESLALPPATAPLDATDSSLAASAFDLPPPGLGGTDTYLRIRVFRI